MEVEEAKMAVYRPPSRSPPPPPSQCDAEPQAETDKISETSNTETDDTQWPELDTQQTQEKEKEKVEAEAKRRRPRWLCSLFPKRARREVKVKKVSNCDIRVLSVAVLASCRDVLSKWRIGSALLQPHRVRRAGLLGHPTPLCLSTWG
jgi:hypothetical protein